LGLENVSEQSKYSSKTKKHENIYKKKNYRNKFPGDEYFIDGRKVSQLDESMNRMT
jgi:hypothetical protein